MFKYVNELSNEIEELEKTITELKVIIKSSSTVNSMDYFRRKRKNMKAKAVTWMYRGKDC